MGGGCNALSPSLGLGKFNIIHAGDSIADRTFILGVDNVLEFNVVLSNVLLVQLAGEHILRDRTSISSRSPQL